MSIKIIVRFEKKQIFLFIFFKGKKRARVANARKDTCSREIFRHEDLKDLVKLERI